MVFRFYDQSHPVISLFIMVSRLVSILCAVSEISFYAFVRNSSFFLKLAQEPYRRSVSVNEF